MANNTNLVARIILRLQDEASRGLDNARQHVGGIGQEVNRVKQLMIGLFSFVAIKEGLDKLVGLSDKYTELSSKVKLATKSVAEYTQAQAEDFAIAQRTRTSLEAVSGLYAKVQTAMRALGGTQTQAQQVTEATAQAFKLSGASAAATVGGIEQFTQALQSLIFRGDEYNSVNEAAPRLMQAIADGMGVPITALRKMAEEGELSSERVTAALLSQKEVLSAEYSQLDITVGGVWQRLENKVLKFVGTSKEANEATHRIAGGIEFVTEHLEGLITLAGKAGEVLLVAFGASKLKALVLYAEGVMAARAVTMTATEAATAATEATAAQAQANVALAQSSLTVAETQIADATATQAAILAARESVLVRLAAINAQKSLIEATIASTATAVEGTAAHYIHTEAVRKLALAEQHRAIVLTELATLGAQQARVSAAATAATTAQAAATEELAAATLAQGEAAAAATVPVTLFAKAIKAISWGVPLVAAAEIGVAIGEWATQFEWVQVAGANAAKNIAKIVALGEALRHPSFDNWAKFWAELDKINARFDETRAAIGRVDKAPMPSVFDKLKASAGDMAEGIDAELTKTSSAAKTHAEAMVKPYEDAAKAIMAAFDAQSAQIDRDLKQRLSAIEDNVSAENQLITASSHTVIDAEGKKTQAVINGQTVRHNTITTNVGTEKEKVHELTDTVIDAEGKKSQAVINGQNASQNAITFHVRSEKEKIAEATQAVIDAEFKKTTAVLNAKIKLDQTWNETYGKAIELARKAGADVSALEKKGADDRINSLQSVVNAYQSSVDSMVDEEHRLLDAVRHTAEERENLSRSVEDKIRALQQKGMGDVQAYADQQRQIDEKQAAAKKAILEGNFSDAKKYAEEAMRLAESTAHAVDNVSKDANGKTQRKEAISENQAIAKSIEQIKESAALADSALSGLGNAQLAQAQNVAKSLEGAKSGLAEFKGELDRTIADVNNKAQVKLSIDASAAQVEMDKLVALTTAKELTVKIKADPINADREIADLQAKLDQAGVKVPAVLAFDKLRDEELAKIQEELRKSITFLTAVPVGIDTTEAVAKLESMKADIDAKLSAPTEAVHKVNPDFMEVFNEINRIKQNTFSTHTIYVQEIQQHASGGPIQFLATGGPVSGPGFRRTTGAISGPGTGTSDDVPIMASNGEFMVKTAAVNYYGTEFMNAVNNMQFPRLTNYATGGAIADSPAAAPANAPTPQMDTINLVFHFGTKSIPVQTSRSLARDLAVQLRSLARAS